MQQNHFSGHPLMFNINIPCNSVIISQFIAKTDRNRSHITLSRQLVNFEPLSPSYLHNHFYTIAIVSK